jgi:Domain of unknown function (DUF4397)
MRLKTWAALAAAALTLPLLGGCGDDNAQKGFVRIINATTEYATLDLYTQGSDGSNDLVVSGTAAGKASSYVDVDKGSYTFNVKSGSAASNAATTSGTISKTDHYSIVTYLTGGVAKAQFLSDEDTAPASGNAKLRVFNAASSEASSVDVYLTTHACNALTVTDTAFASAVSGLQTAYTPVSATSAGTAWNVCVFAAGDKSTLLLDIPALTLKDQEIATLILSHTAGGVLLNGAVLDQQGAMTPYTSAISRVRVAADPVSGLTTVTLNGTEITANAAAQSISSYVTIASASVTAAVTVDGVTTNVTTLPAAAAGSDYTLLVTGTSSNPTATLITDDNSVSTSTTQTVKARVVNGVNNRSGTVSATIDNKTVGTAVFGQASTPYVTIPATTGTSTVNASGVTPTPAPLTGQSFVANGVYTVFIWGDASAPQLTVQQDR